MYMRFVRLKYQEDRVWDAKEFYERRVLPVLEQTEGCLFAGLLQGTIHGEDFISMTVWTTAETAAAYEGSGIFDRLLDESDEVLLGTEVWSTDLPGGDLVVFSGVEPEVEAWNVAGQVDEAVLERVADGRVFVRMVSVRVRGDALDEFGRRFDEDVRPALAETPGCLGAFLVRQRGVGLERRLARISFLRRPGRSPRHDRQDKRCQQDENNGPCPSQA